VSTGQVADCEHVAYRMRVRDCEHVAYRMRVREAGAAWLSPPGLSQIVFGKQLGQAHIRAGHWLGHRYEYTQLDRGF
jgi:hypothetical protein